MCDRCQTLERRLAKRDQTISLALRFCEQWQTAAGDRMQVGGLPRGRWAYLKAICWFSGNLIAILSQ